MKETRRRPTRNWPWLLGMAAGAMAMVIWMGSVATDSPSMPDKPTGYVQNH